MSTISTEIIINADIQKVYNFSKEIEQFPGFMPDVKSIEIIERVLSENGIMYTSNWVGYIKEFNLNVKWTEIDVWNDVKKTCTFEMPAGKGDYEIYKGVWSFFSNEDGSTLVTMELEVEYNVPMIGGLIKKLIAKLVKSNANGMLEAIKNQVENK